MIDREAVQDWLDRYIAAWASGSGDDIARLFSGDAEYRFRPWEPPVVGRNAIAAAWLEEPDEPGTWEAEYHPYAVDGSRAVAVGWSRYFLDATRMTVEATYDNCFLLAFDDDGRCTSFTEWFSKRKV